MYRTSRPPPWANRGPPTRVAALTPGGHSAPRVGPSYFLRGRPTRNRREPLATIGNLGSKRGNLDTEKLTDSLRRRKASPMCHNQTHALQQDDAENECASEPDVRRYPRIDLGRCSERSEGQRVRRPCRSDTSGRKSFAACLTNLRKCRTTTEGSPRRDARSSGAFGWTEPLRRRYTTPSTYRWLKDAGTSEIPSPTATRLSVDAMRGASCPAYGLKPAARHAAIVTSRRPIPGGP